MKYMKLHFGFTILLNSPNEFVRSHAGCGHQRPGRLSESRELVGANPVWISGCFDPIGSGGGRGAASFLRVRSLQSRSHSSSRESTSRRTSADGTPRPEAGAPDPAIRVERPESFRSIFMGLRY